MLRASRMLRAACVILSLSGCGLGFSPGLSHGGLANRAPCSGDEVIEVFNPLEQNVDIYLWTGQGEPSQLIATAGRGQSTIALGTAFEGRSVGFVARVGSEIAPDVKISLRCDKRGP